jgi:hypothetical protein
VGGLYVMLKKRDAKSLSKLLMLGGVFGVIFGVILFFQISEWGKQWERRKALVESGVITPIDGYIAKKWISKHTSSRVNGSAHTDIDNYVLIRSKYDDFRIRRSLGDTLWESLSVNQKLKVYPIEGDYFIPLTDVGGHNWGRWVFLFGGSTPFLIGFLIYIISNKHNKRMDSTAYQR